MTDGESISREAFEEAAARLGIVGSSDHMDELFQQVQGVLRGTKSLLAMDVSDTEPDMAFDPSGGHRT